MIHPVQANKEPAPPDSGKASVFTSVRQAVAREISLKTILEFMDPTEYFWPITYKRYIVLFMVALLIAGIVVSNYYTDWIQQSMKLTRTYMIPVLVFVVGLEPMMFTIILLTAKMPRQGEQKETSNSSQETPRSDIETPVDTTAPSTEFRTALVIPCHKSDRDALAKVFVSAYPYFRPQDIFVVDNGGSWHPDNLSFRDWVRSQDPAINYMWSPIGSKNAAQLVGSMAAKDYDYILTTDDDVSLPPNYAHPIHMINESVKAVCFPLTAIDQRGKTPMFLVAWQDVEYRMAGLTKLAESQICGVCFPHGAGWFVERETLIGILSKYHPTDFIAEDVNSGFAVMRMKKRIAFDARVILATEVPRTLVGPGFNWFKQRIRSWEMGRHGLMLQFILRLFSLNGQRTPWGIFAQKFIMAYSVASIIVDWVRIPVYVTMGGQPGFWRSILPMTFMAVVPVLLYNYWKCWHRPDMRAPILAVLTFPIYKQLYALVSIIGGIRCVLYYLGGHSYARPIYRMVKDGDERCIWLDERFEENPGFLADDREALLRREPAGEKSSQDVTTKESRRSSWLGIWSVKSKASSSQRNPVPDHQADETET